ncbi:MAG: UDP-N-acetylmuramoyl-tripeptide--D-alanyl-D-alanine ligase, partial [Planctomycetota bacterium]
LGNLDGVRRENMAITEGMNAKGLLIVHGDDKPLRALAKGYAGRSVSFGFGEDNDLFAKDVVTSPAGVSFKLNGSRTQVNVPLLGKHNATNALAALAVARRLGVDDDALLHGLLHAEGPAMRMQKMTAGGVTILNDAYNANPASMKAALQLLAEMNTTGRKIAVLGDMLELGEQAESYHKAAGQQVRKAKVDALVTVGDASKWIAEGARAAGLPGSRMMHVPTAEAAARTFASGLQDGDLVLLKGSRGIKLEQIAEAIVASRG